MNVASRERSRKHTFIIYTTGLSPLVVCMIWVQIRHNSAATESFRYGKYGRNKPMSADEAEKVMKRHTMSFVTSRHVGSLVVCMIRLQIWVINNGMAINCTLPAVRWDGRVGRGRCCECFVATEFGCCVIVWVCEVRQEFCNVVWSNRLDEHFIVTRNCLHCGLVVQWNWFLTSGTYFPNVADINYIVYWNLPQSPGSGLDAPQARPTIGAQYNTTPVFAELSCLARSTMRSLEGSDCRHSTWLLILRQLSNTNPQSPNGRAGILESQEKTNFVWEAGRSSCRGHQDHSWGRRKARRRKTK